MDSVDKYYGLMDKFIADMDKQKSNAKMKAFTKDIGKMLKENGVVPYLIECESMSVTGTSFAKEIGYVLEKLDFTEHDKVFKNEIAGLKAKIAIKDMDYNTGSELLGKYQQENELLKKRIIELENFSCQAEQETEPLVEELKQRIAELESRETETSKKEPISDDCRPSIEWYDNRHQSDCIEINRLNTTIDVLIHKVEYLRQFAGLE